MNGLVQMLEMAGNTIQEQNRIIEAQGQEIARLTALIEPAPKGTTEDPLPTPRFSEGPKVMNC